MLTFTCMYYNIPLSHIATHHTPNMDVPQDSFFIDIAYLFFVRGVTHFVFLHITDILDNSEIL